MLSLVQVHLPKVNGREKSIISYYGISVEYENVSRDWNYAERVAGNVNAIAYVESIYYNGTFVYSYLVVWMK